MNRLFRAERDLPIRGNGQRVIRLSQHRHPAQQKTAGRAHVLRFAFFCPFQLSHYPIAIAAILPANIDIKLRTLVN